MSTVFKAMGELSVAAHRADLQAPLRMVVEFPTVGDYQRFKALVVRDTHELTEQTQMYDDQAFSRVVRYMGVELVLSVRS